MRQLSSGDKTGVGRKHRGGRYSDPIIYCVVIDKPEADVPKERCHKCKRLLNIKNSGLCHKCGNFYVRMRMGTLDPEDIWLQERYVSASIKEYCAWLEIRDAKDREEMMGVFI